MTTGYKVIKYSGTKAEKWFKGYKWTGQNSTLAVPLDVATEALKHSDIFSEVGNAPISVAFAAAAGAANVSEITATLRDGEGKTIANGVVNFEVFLSDDAEGAALTSTAASGAVAVKSGEGADLETVTSKKHLRVQSKKDVGTYVLSITDTAKTLFYVCASVGGVTFVSDKLVAGDYG